MYKLIVTICLGITVSIIVIAILLIPHDTDISEYNIDRIKYSIQYHMYRFFQYFQPEFHCPMTIENGNICPISRLNYPIRIWFFWDGPISKTVEFCLSTWKKHCPPDQYEITHISSENILQYVDELHCNTETIKPQLKSDYVRLELMAKYGGIYMDASVIMTTSFETWLFTDSTAYECMHAVYNSKLMSVDCDHPMIESSFLVAPPGHSVIVKWLEQFKRVNSPCSSNDIIEYMMSEPSNIQTRFLDLTYHAVYHSFQHMMNNTEDYPHHSTRFYDNDILQFLDTNYNIIDNPDKKLNLLKQGIIRGPLVKFVKKEREYLDKFLSTNNGDKLIESVRQISALKR